MTNPLDKTIEWFSPHKALKRAQARKALSYYEATKPGRMRKGRRESGTANESVVAAGASLREQARYMEQNHDIARGVLAVLVSNVVGPHGIGIESMPRDKDGNIHQALAKQIDDLFTDWSKKPEVTWRKDWAGAQRLAARALFRDGEMFTRIHAGESRNLDHGTRVPLSLELMESDSVPLDFHSEGSPRILSGVEINGWGRPTAYHFYKTHPADLRRIPLRDDLRRVDAGQILHPAMVDRIGQIRGASIFASVITRLEDLKDYEESERIAAKVAASMAAYIKKGNPDQYAVAIDNDGDPTAREMKFVPGMVFDDLHEGEDIGTIDTTRPNSQLEPHRKGQLRAAASGLYITYSSMAKDYSGTYSSQRQELVEGHGAYGVLSSEFINALVRPVYERFIDMALMSGHIVLPNDVDADTLKDALYIPPQMPWIDPQKEAKAWGLLEENGHASGPEIIRRRGQKPRDVLDQESRWRKDAEEKGLKFATNTNESKEAETEEIESTDGDVDEVDQLKKTADAYGVGVRAGTVTPQTKDEEHFRNQAGLPEMSDEVKEAWESDGGVRRPITLQSGDAFEAAQDQIENEDSDNAKEKDEN